MVGFGVLPAVILVRDLSGPQPIQPASAAQTNLILAITFGAIALLGLLRGLVSALRGSRTRARGA